MLSLEEADMEGLDIDHTEQIAMEGNDNFALLIHGTQPKGSEAGRAIQTMKKEGIEYSYS